MDVYDIITTGLSVAWILKEEFFLKKTLTWNVPIIKAGDNTNNLRLRWVLAYLITIIWYYQVGCQWGKTNYTSEKRQAFYAILLNGKCCKQIPFLHHSLRWLYLILQCLHKSQNSHDTCYMLYHQLGIQDVLKNKCLQFWSPHAQFDIICQIYLWCLNHLQSWLGIPFWSINKHFIPPICTWHWKRNLADSS